MAVAAQRAVLANSGPSHVVRAGESLWSIAQGLLGAAADHAAVAALVERLWALNADRVPSGDPDIIPVGLALLLPDLSQRNEEESR